MKHLIIYANHNTESFNASIRDAISEVYTSAGHETIVRDLYKLGFNPVLSTADFQALHSGSLPQDIVTEQDYIRWADQITFVYPVWWTGMPAILKGYIDRIFLYGFAYTITESGIKGLLNDKKILLFSTTGQSKEAYEQSGMYDAMNLTTNTGIFGFCGAEVLEHIYFPAVLSVDDKTREQYIENAKKTCMKYIG